MFEPIRPQFKKKNLNQIKKSSKHWKTLTFVEGATTTIASKFPSSKLLTAFVRTPILNISFLNFPSIFFQLFKINYPTLHIILTIYCKIQESTCKSKKIRDLNPSPPQKKKPTALGHIILFKIRLSIILNWKFAFILFAEIRTEFPISVERPTVWTRHLWNKCRLCSLFYSDIVATVWTRHLWNKCRLCSLFYSDIVATGRTRKSWNRKTIIIGLKYL